MRSVTLTLSIPGGFHPTNELIDSEPSITRVAVNHLHPLADGSLVLLYELRGDLERARAIIGPHPDTVSFDVAGDDSGIAYVHGLPTPPVSDLLTALSRTSVVVDTPIEIVDGGALFTVVGDAGDVRAFVEALPEAFDVEVERAGEFEPERGQRSVQLTPRQREVLRIALREGYYEIPRRTTQERLANELGVTAETVNEHLRKIELEVLSKVVA